MVAVTKLPATWHASPKSLGTSKKHLPSVATEVEPGKLSQPTELT